MPSNPNRYKESSEISFQECKTFYSLCTRKWQSMEQIARKTGVPRRSVNKFMLKFLALGLVDLAEVFPRHLFRLSKLASKRNASYFERLRRTHRIFQQVYGLTRRDTVTNLPQDVERKQKGRRRRSVVKY